MRLADGRTTWLVRGRSAYRVFVAAIGRSPGFPEPLYFIHYTGWDSRFAVPVALHGHPADCRGDSHDEWVPRSYVIIKRRRGRPRKQPAEPVVRPSAEAVFRLPPVELLPPAQPQQQQQQRTGTARHSRRPAHVAAAAAEAAPSNRAAAVLQAGAAALDGAPADPLQPGDAPVAFANRADLAETDADNASASDLQRIVSDLLDTLDTMATTGDNVHVSNGHTGDALLLPAPTGQSVCT